ncbi:MAG: hypothetical protein ACRCYY_05550 [Trueperaceae bacterium]
MKIKLLNPELKSLSSSDLDYGRLPFNPEVFTVYMFADIWCSG